LSRSSAGKMRKTAGCRLHRGDGEGKGGDESAEGDSVDNEKQRTENGALRNACAKSNCSGLDKVTFIISPPGDNNISRF